MRPAIIRVSAAFFFLNPDLPADVINSPWFNKYHSQRYDDESLSPSYSRTHRRGRILFQFPSRAKVLTGLCPFLLYFVKHVDMRHFFCRARVLRVNVKIHAFKYACIRRKYIRPLFSGHCTNTELVLIADRL